MAKPDNNEPFPRVLRVLGTSSSRTSFLYKIEFFLGNEMVFNSHTKEISYYGVYSILYQDG